MSTKKIIIRPMTVKKTAQQMVRKERIRYAFREQIKIENDIPPPENSMPDGGQEVYPVSRLNVNQSFSHPIVKGHESAQLRSIRSACSSYTKDHPEVQFVVRTISNEGVIRCWRITDLELPKNTGLLTGFYHNLT